MLCWGSAVGGVLGSQVQVQVHLLAHDKVQPPTKFYLGGAQGAGTAGVRSPPRRLVSHLAWRGIYAISQRAPGHPRKPHIGDRASASHRITLTTHAGRALAVAFTDTRPCWTDRNAVGGSCDLRSG